MKIKRRANYALNCDIYMCVCVCVCVCVCIQGKMSNDRNMILNRKATKILTLVHSDLAGPIQPFAKDGYKYVLKFIDDDSFLSMLYFLKH